MLVEDIKLLAEEQMDNMTPKDFYKKRVNDMMDNVEESQARAMYVFVKSYTETKEKMKKGEKKWLEQEY